MADDADTADRPVSSGVEPVDTVPLTDEAVAAVDEADLTEVNDIEETTAVEGATSPRPNLVRLAIVFGVVAIAAVGALAAWLGTQAYKADQQAQQRALFLGVGRQGTLNLTTIRAGEADTDVQRILDSSTGIFHDDFQKRSEPFVDLVKQTQASSEGTITEAGVESITDDAAQILVSVAVKTTTPGAAPDQQPRLWRMRLNVQKVDDGAKVSDVVFVP